MTRTIRAALLSGAWLALLAAPALADDGPPGDGSACAPASESSDDPSSCASAPSGRFELGVGYQPDDGLVFGAGVVNDRLFGSRHGLALTALLSERRQEFDLRYDARDLAGFDLSVDLFDHRRSYDAFTRHGTGARIGLSRALTDRTSAFLSWRLERIEADDLAPTPLAAGAVAPPLSAAPGLVSALRAGLRYDDTDGAGLGSRGEIYLERALPALGSDFDLATIGASFHHGRRLAGPLVLRLSGSATAITGRRGQVIPLAERLMFEGHADVRGWDLSTGPRFGAQTKATGRAELELPLVPQLGLYGAVFYDAGLMHDPHLDAGGLRQSVGGSLIWRSPIGPVRVDLARPLGEDRGVQVLFSLGGPF